MIRGRDGVSDAGLAVALLFLASVVSPDARGQAEVVGLEAGERAGELAPGPEAPADGSTGALVRYGRVLDAFTGRPLPGAAVEVWSEEIDEVFGGFHCFGEAVSGADGRFAVRRGAGSRDGGKARVCAPGYLTLSCTLGDLLDPVRLFPAAAQPFRIRVVDSRGRPIAGARITSTYSCSHDAPAFDLTTGTDGIAVCPEYGLQDAVPELRVRAEGYAAIEYLDADAALGGMDASAPLTVYLPRRRPFSVRLLDEDGNQAANLPVLVHDDECYHVTRTDKAGFLRVSSRYGNGEVMLEVLRPERNTYVGSFTPPRQEVVTLRPQPEEWPGDMPVGKIRIAFGDRDPEGERALLELHHEDGWMAGFGGAPEDPVEFPAGRGFLLVGGAFSGHEQEVIPFDLAAGEEVTMSPRFEREPRVTLRAAEGFEGTVWIEAGDETLEGVAPGQTVAVPGGRSLCVLHEGDARILRLLSPPVRDGQVLDFTLAEVVWELPAAPAQTTQQQVAFTDTEGTPLPGRLIPAGGDAGWTIAPGEDSSSATHEIVGPVGAPWLARFDAPGHETIWLRGRLDAGAAPLRRTVPASASVRIEASFPFEVIGYDNPLEDLAPGPLSLVLQCPDGRRLGIDLVLAPGARRVIRLR